MIGKMLVDAMAAAERRQTSETDPGTPGADDPTETRTPGRQTAWPHRGDWLAAPLWGALVIIVMAAVASVLLGLGIREALGQEWYDRNPDQFTVELQSRSGVIICEEGPSAPSHIGTWKYHSCWHTVLRERGYCMNLAPIAGAEVGAAFYCRPTVELLDRFVNQKFRSQ